MKTFVTFGSDHVHHVQGRVITHDCVAVVNGNRDDVFALFGPEFCMEYPEQYWDHDKMNHYFPAGYVHLEAPKNLQESSD